MFGLRNDNLMIEGLNDSFERIIEEYKDINAENFTDDHKRVFVIYAEHVCQGENLEYNKRYFFSNDFFVTSEHASTSVSNDEHKLLLNNNPYGNISRISELKEINERFIDIKILNERNIELDIEGTKLIITSSDRNLLTVETILNDT